MRLFLFFCGGSLLLAACLAGIRWGKRPDERVIHSDAVLTRTFAQGETAQTYGFDLHPGEWLAVTVEQIGLDVEVTLADPQSHTVLDVDSQNGLWGNEVVEWVASMAGHHQLAIQCTGSCSGGSYRISIHLAPAATPGDRARAQAVARLSRARYETSPQKALSDSRAALLLWLGEGEPEQAVLALLQIADLESRGGSRGREIAAYRQALDLLERHPIARLRLTVLQRSGRAYRLAGDLRQSRAQQEEALALARTLHDARLEAVSLQNLAVIEDAENSPVEALRLYRRALAVLSPVDHPADVAVVLHNLGATQSLLGQYGDALDSFTSALHLRRQLGARGGIAATLTEIGWLHYLDGRASEAIGFYREALELDRQTGDQAPAAGTLDRLGSAYRALGLWGEALSVYRQSLDINRRRDNLRDQANTQLNMAELAIDQGLTADAHRALSRSLGLLSGLPDPDPHAGIHALYLRSRIAEADGDLAAALADSEQVLFRLDAVRQGLDSQVLSLPFFATRRAYLDHHLDLLMARERREPGQGWDRRALAAAERGRARGLLETLMARGAPGPPLSPETRRREALLHERLNALELSRLMAGPPGEQERAALDPEHAIVAELAEIEAPGYGAPLPALDVAGIQALLDDETLLLYYHLGDKHSYLWRVGRGSLAAFTLPPRAALAAFARELNLHLPTAHLDDPRDRGRFAARRLGLLLLGPVADTLAHHRLVFVADSVLATVPLGTLLDPGTAAPLVFRHEVVQVPSAAVLALLRQRAAARERPPSGQVAVLGDPVFTGGDPRVHPTSGAAIRVAEAPGDESLTRSARSLGLYGFPRLSSSRRESEAIAALVPRSESLLALDFAASRATVTSGRLRDFRILHFATHALLHPLPELSGLVLSLVDSQGRPQDGFLRAHEIATLDLPADLVVLSSCRSAMGPEVLGEGLMSLPRSLMQAGATRVLVSLWNVEDGPTALFMSHFYQELLAQRRSSAAALRATQEWMAQQPAWSAPLFWAGFELQGDWQETPPPGGNSAAVSVSSVAGRSTP